MVGERESLGRLDSAGRPMRRRLGVRTELLLAVFPTLTVLGMLVLLEALTQQRLLFASLASSAFLIYLDPLHGTNHVRTLVTSHLTAATLGLLTFLVFGHDFLAAGLALVGTIVAIIVMDVVHPPAISTSLIFALRSGTESEILLFALALAIVAVLVALQRTAIWLLARAIRSLDD
jgi:CBS-domain-containing membrane protein